MRSIGHTTDRVSSDSNNPRFKKLQRVRWSQVVRLFSRTIGAGLAWVKRGEIARTKEMNSESKNRKMPAHDESLDCRTNAQL
jgi:hypothetical protein